MATMRVIQVSRPGGPLELVERPIPEPGPGSVRIKVQACGICHSDVLVKAGGWPGIQYPRIPGHEVVGTLDQIGAGVSAWTLGQRVGVGWHGGQDGTCLLRCLLMPVEGVIPHLTGIEMYGDSIPAGTVGGERAARAPSR